MMPSVLVPITDPQVLSVIPQSAMTGGPRMVTVNGDRSITFYMVENGQVHSATDKEIWNFVMHKSCL